MERPDRLLPTICLAPPRLRLRGGGGGGTAKDEAIGTVKGLTDDGASVSGAGEIGNSSSTSIGFT